jgi:hypothetical protein
MENINGQIFTKVYHKPSYKPYYLPFNSVHPIHMKKNILSVMLTRAIEYCSTFETYLNEREKLRMALLLSKYPGVFIDKQFDQVLKKFHINQPLTSDNYNIIRDKIMNNPEQKEKILIDYGKTMFIHFTYCLNMKTFPTKFHILCNRYFSESPINDVRPVLGTRNMNNLQQQLVHNKQ